MKSIRVQWACALETLVQARKHRLQPESLLEKEERLKQQKRKIQSAQGAQERKARNHRLIQIGAIVEEVYGKPLNTEVIRQGFRDWLIKALHKGV